MGLCHLQENALFKIYTQPCIFYGISYEAQPCAEIPYYVQIHFQVLLGADLPSPEPNPRRTSLAEEGGGNPETLRLMGVKEPNTTFLSTQGFWFEVCRCQRHCWVQGCHGSVLSSCLGARGDQEHDDIFLNFLLLLFFFSILHINQYLPVILCFCFCFLADFYQ